MTRSLARGEALWLSGERNGRIYLVTDGILKLSAGDSDGNESILELAVPGDLIGEIAALDGSGQPFDAVATARAQVIGLDAAFLMNAIAASPEAAMEMLRLLGRRNRRLYATAFERTSSYVPARLAGRLLDLAATLGHHQGDAIDLELPIAQQDLGRFAGMSRESACKTLTHFKRGGVLDYRGRRMRILRPDVLEKIRCAGRVAGPSR